MNKEEFLKKLRTKLSILDEKEIDDIIEEYSNHIAMKIKDGKSEKEAIKDFGNINDLAKEILSAYKINNNYAEGNDSLDKFIGNVATWLADFFKKLGTTIGDKKNEEVVTMVFKIVVIVFIVMLCKLPFIIIEHLGYSILSVFPVGYSVLKITWQFLINAGYLIFAIVFLIVAIRKVLNTEEVELKPKAEKTVTKSETKKTEEKTIVKPEVKKEPEKVNTLKEVISPFTLILKIFVIILTIPIGFALFGLVITLGILIVLLFNHIYLTGLFLIILGLIIIINTFLALVYHLMFPKGAK